MLNVSEFNICSEFSIYGKKTGHKLSHDHKRHFRVNLNSYYIKIFKEFLR